MTRIYWDSMLFIYLFDRNPDFYPRVEQLFVSTVKRGDELVTSHLALGELLAGAYRSGYERAEQARGFFSEMGVRLLTFEGKSAERFGRLRAETKVRSADALHLASAAAYGVDLFLTADTSLLRLKKIDGIGFIASMHTDLF